MHLNLGHPALEPILLVHHCPPWERASREVSLFTDGKTKKQRGRGPKATWLLKDKAGYEITFVQLQPGSRDQDLKVICASSCAFLVLPTDIGKRHSFIHSTNIYFLLILCRHLGLLD